MPTWWNTRRGRSINEAKVNESKPMNIFVDPALAESEPGRGHNIDATEAPETPETDLASKLKASLADSLNEPGHAQDVFALVEAAEESPEGVAPVSLENLALWVEDLSAVRDFRDRWMRSVAELENFKKRSAQERSNLIKHGADDLLRELLPIIDNLNRALAHGKKAGEAEATIQGVEMTIQMFQQLLERNSVQEIRATGEQFDPRRHEAVARTPAGTHEPNMVAEELEKGYMRHDRLLRPSKVVVAIQG